MPLRASTNCLRLAAILLGLASPLARADSSSGLIEGSRCDWARLRSSSPYWDRHSHFDQVFVDYVHAETGLNLVESPRPVVASSLESLCSVPLIFAANLESLPEKQAENLGEYLKRGGFIVVDYCTDPEVIGASTIGTLNPKTGKFTNGNPLAAYEQTVQLLRTCVPQLHIAHLPRDHPIFNAYFDLRARAATGPRGDATKTDTPAIGPIVGLYFGNRLIGVMTAGLECDLAGFERNASPFETAQLLTNIYVYAMMGTHFESLAP